MDTAIVIALIAQEQEAFGLSASCHPTLRPGERSTSLHKLSFPAGTLNFESSCGVCDG